MMTPEQRAEFEAIKAGRQPQAQQDEEFPWLDPAQVASNQDKYEAEQRENRLAYRKAFDEGSGFDQFMAGVGKPVLQTEAGLMSALGLGDDAYKRDAREGVLMMEEQHGIPATAGNIVGDIAMTTIPAVKTAQATTRALKGTSGITKAGAAGLAESALIGGYEGLKAPETGENRFDNAVEAAAWTAALGLPGNAIRSSRESVSKNARKLLDKGVRLTPGMASQTGAATTAEKFMSNIPFIGPRVKALQDTAINDWNRHILNRVAPDREMKGVSNIGHRGFKEVQEQFTDAYKEIWGDVTPGSVDKARWSAGIKAAYDELDLLPADVQKRVNRDLGNITMDFDRFLRDKTGNPKLLENIDDVLREKASNAPDMISQEYYQKLRKLLTESLETPAVKQRIIDAGGVPASEQLKLTDKLYREFKVVEHGAGNVAPQERGAVFTPRNLESAIRAKSTPSATTKGRGPLQYEATKATGTVAQVLPERSEISTAADVSRWGSLLGLANFPAAVAAVPFSPVVINETMRKAMTGKPLTTAEQAVLAAARQAGVSGLMDTDEIRIDPQFLGEPAEE
jgi:hypothetical protein